MVWNELEKGFMKLKQSAIGKFTAEKFLKKITRT